MRALMSMSVIGFALAACSEPIARAETYRERAAEFMTSDCRIPRLTYGTFTIYASELTWKGSQLTLVFEIRNVNPKAAKAMGTAGGSESSDTISGTLSAELFEGSKTYAPDASSLSSNEPISSNGGPKLPPLTSMQSRLVFEGVPRGDYTFKLTRVRANHIEFAPEEWTCLIPAVPGDVSRQAKHAQDEINDFIERSARRATKSNCDLTKINANDDGGCPRR